MLFVAKILIALLGFVLALMVATTEIGLERNDLDGYFNYYNCLGAEYESIESCNQLIGNPYDVIYQYLAFIFKFISSLDFSYFIFFVSFSIFYTVARVVYCSSKASLFSLLFVLVDFRFWEYGFNTIRYGISLSFLLLAFEYRLKSGAASVLSSVVFGLLSIFSHVSGVIAVSLFFRFRLRNFLILILLCFFYYSFFSLFYSNVLLSVLPIELKNKLSFYINLDRAVYSIPLHYLAVMIYAVYLYFGRKIVSPAFAVSFNIVQALFVFSVLLYPLGMAYRAFSFMTPFIAIIFGYQVSYIAHLFQVGAGRIIVYSTFIIFLLALVFKNYEFILRGFHV